MDTLTTPDKIAYGVIAYLVMILIVDIALMLLIPRTALDLPDQEHCEKRRESLIFWCTLIWPATLLLVFGSTIPPVRKWLTAYLNGGHS